jgi:hypothetical protein
MDSPLRFPNSGISNPTKTTLLAYAQDYESKRARLFHQALGHSIILGPNNQEMPRMMPAFCKRMGVARTEYAEIEERAHCYKDADE